MKNNAIDYIQENITDIIGSDLTFQQRSRLKAVFEDAKNRNLQEMKDMCYKVLETCETPISGSLNDYFELTYKQVFQE